MLRFLPFLFLIASCAPAQFAGTDRAMQSVAATALGPPQSCVGQSPGHALVIEDNRTLSYRRGATLWINRLPDRCPGLSALDVLIIETHSGQLCRGDHVRALKAPGGIPGPVCVLGDFVPYRAR